MRAYRLIVIAAALLGAAPAHADQAGTLKQQGLRAAKGKDWEAARELFEQSYALDRRPLTLFNLAVAQEHTGKLLEARESYAAFLEQAATGDSETFRKLAKDAIPALDKAIPTLRVRATGLAADDAIEVDGRPLSIAAPIPLDPGSHTVVVRRGREAIAQRTVALSRAAHDDVELAVPLPPPVLLPRVEPRPEPANRLTFEQAPAAPPREHPGLLRSRWFWGVTAAVVAVAAGATYYYLNAPTHDPTRGTLGPAIPVP